MRMMFGPYTAWVASRLLARKGELGISYDKIVELTGVSKPAVHGALNGKQAIALEVYVLLCDALQVDAGDLLDQAEAALTTTPTPPSVFELAADYSDEPTDYERFEAEHDHDDPA